MNLLKSAILLIVTASLAGCLNPARSSVGWGVCCSFTGEGCSPPATNCYDDVIVTPSALGAYHLLDESVARGTTAAFFAGEGYNKVFPDFGKFPKHVNMLRNGLPLLRLESGKKGLVYYVATRQSREKILAQMRAKSGPISGVEFAIPVRQKQ